MPITFKSRHSPNILMFESVALELIKMMGHSGTVPGSLAAGDVAPALTKLKEGIAAASRQSRTDPSDDRDDETDEPSVSLAHRAIPLIAMLETALTNDDYVIWGR